MFPFKELYENVKDSEPMPSFYSKGRTLGQRGDGTNTTFAIQGESAKAGTSQSRHPHATSSQPRCMIKWSGAVFKNAE